MCAVGGYGATAADQREGVKPWCHAPMQVGVIERPATISLPSHNGCHMVDNQLMDGVSSFPVSLSVIHHQ